MAVVSRWQKALMGSLAIHVVFVFTASWLSAMAFMPVPEQEKEIELEMIEPGDDFFAAPLLASTDPVSQPAPDMTIPQTVPAPQVVTPVAELPVIAVEPPAATVTMPAAAPVSGKPGQTAPAAGSVQGSGNAAGQRASSKGVIAAPGILDRVEPGYPERARRSGWEGTVILKIQIMENGRTGSIDIASSSGYEALDEAAVSAVEKWRFIPARDKSSGQPVGCYTTMPIIFKLRV